MSDITVISAESYLASPCSSLPLPYSICGGRRLGAIHMGGLSGSPGKAPENAYSRLMRRTGDMQRFVCDGYSARQLFIIEEPEDAGLCRSLAEGCGASLDTDALVKKPYFNERLCAAVHSRSTGECVCAGIAGCDEALHEAWFERLLIPEGVLGQDAARLLINELLRRISPIAGFVTALAPYGSALERLLRKSGFTGGDIWRFDGKSALPRI